jgi:hypothetical protein
MKVIDKSLVTRDISKMVWDNLSVNPDGTRGQNKLQLVTSDGNVDTEIKQFINAKSKEVKLPVEVIKANISSALPIVDDITGDVENKPNDLSEQITAINEVKPTIKNKSNGRGKKGNSKK